jgi:hypothetical protein
LAWTGPQLTYITREGFFELLSKGVEGWGGIVEALASTLKEVRPAIVIIIIIIMVLITVTVIIDHRLPPV